MRSFSEMGARQLELALRQTRQLTRRAALTGTLVDVGVPALSVSPSLASFDPIALAIDAHRRVYADLTALLAAQDAADKALRDAEAFARPVCEARLAALCAAEGPLGCAEMKAAARIAETVPNTLENAAAVLRYVRERFERDGYPMYEEDGYRASLFSTERAICRLAKF